MVSSLVPRTGLTPVSSRAGAFVHARMSPEQENMDMGVPQLNGSSSTALRRWRLPVAILLLATGLLASSAIALHQTQSLRDAARTVAIGGTALYAHGDAEQRIQRAYGLASAASVATLLLGLSLAGLLALHVWQAATRRRHPDRDKELLSATLQSIAEGVLATDATGRVRMLNRCGQELTGWDEEEAVGHPLTDVLEIAQRESGTPTADPGLHALRAGESVRLTEGAILRSRTGEERPVQGVATPVKIAGNEVLGAVVVFRDVSEQVRSALALRESELRAQSRAGELEAVMQSVPAAILIANDLQCRDITGNAAAYRLLRAPIGSSLAASAEQRTYFAGDSGEGSPVALKPEELPLQRAIAERREIANVELQLCFRNGDVHTIMGNAAPLRDSYGQVRGAVVALIDVTERKHIEAQLKQAHRRKDEFLATLAHELRNPLAPVRSGVAILRKERDGAVAGKTLAMMERQLTQMVRLIDDLLDVSRITGDRIELRREPVPLLPVIEQAIEAAKPYLDSGGHAFEWEMTPQPLWVDGDASRLSQVVSNLLTNAAKYTPEGGNVRLVVDREESCARIEVIDNGLGIPPEMLHQVFDLFTQVNRSLHRVQGGLGVGLSLVRRLVEMHDGTVEASSQGLGLGSTFTVRLPLSAAAPRALIPAAQTGAHAGPPMRVLVVDDNRDAADSLALVLEGLGHEARVAYSAQESLTVLEGFTPHLAFLDIGMPVTSGYELARTLRAEPALRSMRLVALTGWGEESDRARSHDAGFDLHVTKPIDTPTLESVLADMAARGESGRGN